MSRALLLLSLAATAAASSPSIGPLDAGVESWAQQAMFAVVGRNARGAAEVRVLADLVAASDRRVVARALTKSPGYVQHWSERIVNRMGVELGGQYRQCYGEPLRSGPIQRSLAEHLRAYRPDCIEAECTAPGGPFNVGDVLRSALVLDDLSPYFRAHLFALLPLRGECNDGNTPAAEAGYRRRVGEQFAKTYLNRGVFCGGCHRSAVSTTDAGSDWDRHHPVAGALDRAVLGDAARFRPANFWAVFRSDVCRGHQPAGFTRPWGMSAYGYYRRELGPDPLGAMPFLAGPLSDESSIFDVEERFWSGVDGLACDGLTLLDPDAGDARSEYSDPIGSRPVGGEEALAYMTAMRFVEVVWEEVMGTRLTLVHGFPRNPAQRDVLWFLTDVFVASGWSLRTLLTAIVTSDAFNRGVAADGDDLPMVFDPWVADRPVSPPSTPTPQPMLTPQPTPPPGRERNSVGDAVHARRGRWLLTALDDALGWGRPARFPDGGHDCEFPCNDVLLALGEYHSDEQPGFRAVDFVSLLAWEETTSPCDPPNGSDWIDRLLATATARVTVGELAIAMRDRLLVGALADTEELECIASLVATELADGLETPLAALDAAGRVRLEEHLRELCGVLVQSPQFLLAGRSSSGRGEPPALAAGGDTRPYVELCRALVPAFDTEGYTLTCADSELALTDPRQPAGVALCPPGICSRYPQHVTADCMAGAGSCRLRPPRCDPRGSGLGGCGGLTAADDTLHVAWADGARVLDAANVRVLERGAKAPRALVQGDVLDYGDLIEVATDAALTLELEQTRLVARPWEVDAPRYLLVSGEAALPRPEPKREIDLKAARDWFASEIELGLEAEWRRHGELGELLALTPEELDPSHDAIHERAEP